MAEPVEIVGAIAASPSVCTDGFQQTSRLVEAQILHAHPDQFSRHGDSVDATVCGWFLLA